MRALLPAILVLLACSDDAPGSGGSGSASSSSGTARARVEAPSRTGGALMRSADGARLYLADEDHKTVRILPIPFAAVPEEPKPAASAKAAPPPKASASASAKAKIPKQPPPPGVSPRLPPVPSAKQQEFPVPGATAALLPVDGFVLVTIRDPGFLLVLKETPNNDLEEQARISVAPDAWGLAITKDEKIAVVTSAWSHKVSGVDWRAGKLLWTLDVAREPRGVVIHPNGKTAYVSHLTSADLTRIDGIDGSAPKAKQIAFPAAPSRTPLKTPVEGSLGYALVMDDAGNRLLAARHALGGLADDSWFGIPTIDVLQTANDTPLLAPRVPEKRIKTTPAFDESRRWALENFSEGDHYLARQYRSPELPRLQLVQPRAMIVARKSQTVWLASEGDDSVGEFPLVAAAPSERPLRIIHVGRRYKDAKIIGSGYSETDGIPGECGAPTGLALNADESLLYVFCRSTYDVATVRLGASQGWRDRDRIEKAEVSIARVAKDPIDDDMSRGRRLFYGGRDDYSSGGMGCAGCHPEGRDDAHVWHEVVSGEQKLRGTFLATKNLAFKTNDGKLGYARQTPMLAGRVNAKGPYGWHAHNANLRERLAEGFERHRWFLQEVDASSWMVGERAKALEVFLRKGLVTPPKLDRELSEQEKQGKQIFESDGTQCNQCHVPDKEFTNREAAILKRIPPPPGFEEEKLYEFKTPSLLFVGGTAPYYHDGHAPTLQALIEQNNDRMGKTNHLSSAQRAALIAYLETL
jgi:hypothetical protein